MHLGVRVARVETDLPEGSDSPTYMRYYTGEPAQKRSWEGVGFSQKCCASVPVALPGGTTVVAQGQARTFVRNDPVERTGNKMATEVEEREREQPRVPAGCLSTRACTQRACICPSLRTLLPALPSWPPHCAGCFQPNSSCQDCIPDPSAPAVRGYVLNLHSAFFFVHLE